MKNTSKTLGVFFVLLLTASMFLGASTVQAAEVVLRVGMLVDPISFNKASCWNMDEHERLVWEPLLQHDLDLSIIPGLAESWEVSEDRKTYTFHLVENATWHDGEKFTSEDVEFTLENQIENEWWIWQAYAECIESVEAPDDYTVVVKVKEAYDEQFLLEQFPTKITILPKHIWGDLTSEEFLELEDEVGTGPWIFEEWEKGQYMSFEANKDYYYVDDRPRIDKLVWVLYALPESMATALQKGEIDFAGRIPEKMVATLIEDPNINVHVSDSANLRHFCINVFEEWPDGTPGEYIRPGLVDHNVRLAMAHAVDKQTIVDVVHAGYGEPGTALMNRINPLFNDELEPYEFDLNLSRTILENAGYIDRDDDGIREGPDGTPLDYTVHICRDVADEERSFELIREWFKEIGINLKLEIADGGYISELLIEYDIDMMAWGWAGGPYDPQYLLAVLTSKNLGTGWNEPGWWDADYDTMFEEQMTAVGEERRQIVFEMQEMVYEDIAYIILYYPKAIYAWRSDLWEPFEMHAFGQKGQWGFAAGALRTFIYAEPLGEEQLPDEGAAIPLEAWLIAGGGVVVAVVAIVYALRKRK